MIEYGLRCLYRSHFLVNIHLRKKSIDSNETRENLGSDLVNWLFENVDGFVNRNDARKYASSMLKAGYIRHTVHKLTFSEQCYYVFGDIYSQGKPNKGFLFNQTTFFCI